MSIRRWLTQPGAGPQASRKLRAISEAMRELRSRPESWPVGDHPEVRQRPTEGGYTLMYRILSDKPGPVLIIRIFGPFQDRGRL